MRFTTRGVYPGLTGNCEGKKRVLSRQTTVTILFALLSVSYAIAADLSIEGYYKNFFVVYDAPKVVGSISFPDEPLIGSVSNRLRLDLKHRPNDWLSLKVSYNIVPRVQDPSLFESPANRVRTDFPSYRFADLDPRIYPADDEDVRSFGLFQNLDRASISMEIPAADLYIGRQAIAWGSGHAVNPTDIFSPFTFDELDTEDRLGVDAIRVRVPLEQMGELDAGYIFGDDFAFEESAFYLRGKFYRHRTDMTALLAGFRENLLIGADITRSVGGAGFWLESAYVFVDALNETRDGSDDNYLRATIGTDYALTEKLYGFIEYHFSQAGTDDQARYLDLLTTAAYTSGAVYLLGRHYLIPGFSFQLTPLLTFSGQLLTNLEDPSSLFAPHVEYNIFEDIYLAGGAFIGLGRRPEGIIEGDQGPSIRFRSEFGGYSDLYFSSFRFYF
jgi:hypothetical protein